MSKIDYTERINRLAKYAKKVEFNFPTLTQKYQQAYSRIIGQTGISKEREGLVRTYKEYLEYGEKTLKDKFSPITESDYYKEVKQLYEDIKEYRTEKKIREKQYESDKKFLDQFEEQFGYRLDDDLEIRDFDRSKLLKEAYRRLQENPQKYDPKYGYFEAVEEVFNEEMEKRQGA